MVRARFGIRVKLEMYKLCVCDKQTTQVLCDRGRQVKYVLSISKYGSSDWILYADSHTLPLMSSITCFMGYRAFSLPGQFAPRSESANRTLANSLPGTFAPWPSRSLASSFSGPFAPRPFRSRERKFYGTFAPLMCLSPCTFAVLHL